MNFKASLSLTGILIPLFALFLSVLFGLTLQLSALITLSLTLGVSLALPTIAIAIGITASLIVGFNLALGFSLPSFTLDIALALDFELILVLGFLAILDALIAAIINASLVAYGWFGSAQALGAALTSELANGWPDGTDASATVTCYMFVATTSGSYAEDQIASLGMMPVPPAPPVPPSLPPDVPYPPPQAYETGLAGITISPPTAPGGVQATGVVTVDDSVSTGIGAITSISIVEHGSGYTSIPLVQVTDSVAIVSATTATPIVVTLPNALTIPVGQGLGITVAGVVGNTTIAAATATSPIAITIPSTTGLVTCSIQAGDYGLDGLVGTWFVRGTSPTTCELYQDAGFTLPSAGTGVYVADAATLSGNICGLQCAKVTAPTTVELYSDPAFTLPVAGYGTYTGGTVTGGGAGAAALTTMGGGATRALKSLLDGLRWPTSTGLAGGVITFRAMLATMFTLMLDLQGNLQARANILASCSIGATLTPPTIAASLEFLAAISANLTANLAVKLPSLSAALGASISAQLNAVASLTARIGFFLGLGDVTLEIWQYTGPASGLGAAVASGPGGAGWHDGTAPTTSVTAAVFGLTNPASSAAFSAIFSGATA